MDENDPDEPERRARHMAEQRDRLIAMKKAFNLFAVINVCVSEPGMQNIEF